MPTIPREGEHVSPPAAWPRHDAPAVCDDIRIEASAARTVVDASPGAVREALDRLDRDGLVLRQHGKVMSLVTRGILPIPDAREEFPGGYVDLDSWHAARERSRETIT